MDAVLRGELERLFDDFGTRVVYRRVSATFDPSTQRSTESVLERGVTAILGETRGETPQAAGGQGFVRARRFRIRAHELGSGPATSDRIAIGATEYDVVSAGLSSDGAVWEIVGRER
jgi:hypothetical protein